MRFVLLAFILFAATAVSAANLIHQYDFNGSMTDSFGTSTLQVVHVASSGYGPGYWSWTAGSTPGGGLLLGTMLPNNDRYTLHLVFTFNNLNSNWTKIVSMTGLSGLGTGYFNDDTGVYFNGNYFGFYNTQYENTTAFSPNVWYDLYVTRSAGNDVRLYIAPLGETPHQLIQFNDTGFLAKPSKLSTSPGALSYFGLFYDDTHTTAEWTIGGSVSQIQVFDDVISFDMVQNPVIEVTDTTVHLMWDSYLGASSYNIYEATSPGGTWTLLRNTSATGIYLGPVETRKFYQIRAVIN